MPASFPLFEARGTPRELGRQHGEQCRPLLLAFIDDLSRSLGLSMAGMRERGLKFLPHFRQHCPHLLEEIEGLAEGARVSLAEALLPQIRGELRGMTTEACTTFVLAGSATAAGEILIGQNSDVEPEMGELGYILRLEPVDRPKLMMWTFGGQIGYHGVNSAGVAHFANALAGGPGWKFALPHYPVKRMMLECQSIDEVLRLIRRAPVCSNGNYVLCDGAGRIADVELTPDGFELLDDDGKGFLVHTNHYLCGAHACKANHDISVPDTFPRLERMRSLVDERRGKVTVQDVQTFLADHDGHPTSICRHPHSGPDHPSVSARGHTAASLIAEPARGLLHACRGNPCTGEFVTYRL